MSGRVEVLGQHLWKKTGSGGGVPEYEDQFLYTLGDGGGILSREQRWFYEQNGYIVIPDLIPHSILDRCQERFIELCEGRIPRGNITLMKDISVVKAKGNQPQGEALYYKAQDILYDEIFQQFFLYDKMLDIVQCMTGKDIMGMHSMLINKPPDVGTLSSRHPPHQDLYYFPFRPADRIVAAWTAMEPVSPANGCLFVLPGTHRGVLHPHMYPEWEGGVNKAFHGIPDMENVDKTFVPMSKGDTVFFHPLLIHGSGYNTTKGYRKAISCHYASSECYYVNVMDTVQEPIAKEIEGMAEKKGLKLDIHDIWRYRSLLVRGEQGGLS